MEPKIWYQSKTIIVNVLTVIVAILAFVLDANMAGGLPFEIDPRWVAIAIGIANILLRSVTNQPISQSKGN